MKEEKYYHYLLTCDDGNQYIHTTTTEFSEVKDIIKLIKISYGDLDKDKNHEYLSKKYNTAEI